MAAGKQIICALALIAVVGCAHAKPQWSRQTPKYPTKGSHKDLSDTSSNSVNPFNISTSSTKETLVKNGDKLSLEMTSEAGAVSCSVKAELPNRPEECASRKQSPQAFQDASKPVHQRFPHAVLFGGTCGGSIISEKWILTAAHCTLFTGGRHVLAGTGTSDDGSGVTVAVKQLHVHPLFTVGPYWLDPRRFHINEVAARHDFMLAELQEPLKLDGANISAVELPTACTAPGDLAAYAGYGADHHGGTMRSEMHAMELEIRSNKDCKALLEFNPRDMICAKGFAPRFDSACNGDSGSGLVHNGQLVGVTSWVQNDALECKPGNLVVFSRVEAALPWIHKTMNTQTTYEEEVMPVFPR